MAAEQGVLVRFTTAQGVEMDRALGEVDLHSHQPLIPDRRGHELVAQEVHRALLSGVAEVDHLAAEGSLQVELPASGKTTSRRGAGDTFGVPIATGRGVALWLCDHL